MTIVAFEAITGTGNFSVNTHIMDINTTGCIPPNKIPLMTIVAFRAITGTGNVSIYIHIVNINTTGCLPGNKIP